MGIYPINVGATQTDKMATSNPVEEIRPWITSLVISSIGMQRLDIVDTSIKSLYGDLKRKDAIGK